MAPDLSLSLSRTEYQSELVAKLPTTTDILIECPRSRLPNQRRPGFFFLPPRPLPRALSMVILLGLVVLDEQHQCLLVLFLHVWPRSADLHSLP